MRAFGFSMLRILRPGAKDTTGFIEWWHLERHLPLTLSRLPLLRGCDEAKLKPRPLSAVHGILKLSNHLFRRFDL